MNTLSKIVLAATCMLLPATAMSAPPTAAKPATPPTAAPAPATSATPDPARRYIADPASKRPLSSAVLVRDTLYLSGSLGLDKAGQVPADPKVEIKTIMDNLKQTIESAGLKIDDLVSVQVFCTDLTLFDTFNEVYRTYFTSGNFPSRAFIGTDKLLRGARFEVQGIAVKTPR